MRTEVESNDLTKMTWRIITGRERERDKERLI